jgi:hypothetical protein
MNYKTNESLLSTENNDIINASELEKIKLSDEIVNKNNLSKVIYRTGLNTDNLARTLFLDDKYSKNTEIYDDINSEKYNVPIRSSIVTGSKVFNSATKNDIMNELRVSDINFTI